MKIGEIAEKLGVTTSRIRFYEKSGLLTPDRRWDNGYRDYSSEDVAFLKMVLMAQDLGFSLREIKDMAADLRAPTHNCGQTLDRLRDKRKDVARRIQEMRQLERNLSELIVRYETQHADDAEVVLPAEAKAG